MMKNGVFIMSIIHTTVSLFGATIWVNSSTKKGYLGSNGEPALYAHNIDF